MDAIGGAGDADARADAGRAVAGRPAAIGIPEIFHLDDRAGRHFILPMTHEETVTFHARELQIVPAAAADARTTSRRRTATSRGRAAGSCACASSS